MSASSSLTLLTRVGFATRGLLYTVIAVLVLRTGRTEDPAGALAYLGDGGGRVLLAIMAAGLLAYGLWRLSDAAFDIERHGSERKGLVERAGAAISGIVHLFLTYQAVRLMQGIKAAKDSAEQGTQTALALPGGTFLVMLGGVLLLVVGGVQLAKAIKAGFLRYLEPDAARRAWVQWSGRLGYAARGLIFLVTGFFLLRAGFSERASAAGGMAEAIDWLSSPVDLLVAIGLLGFGIFSFIEARYRVLHDVPVDDAVRKVTGAR
ncbi:DUF1206 domain-containing protein [Sphingomonas sp. TZW2008]|uniref:DUF1206 domain-containing protein n=1 Tax=Sphingomonas sp. TZW2008 TaxID=1917973 RepID=UPI000A26A8DA|nr:DUF1206 domain-containing protein [Sphingomonas sp. TZW2008]